MCHTEELFPSWACVEGRCSECPKLTETYSTLLDQAENTNLKYTQWEHTKLTYTNSKGKKIDAKLWEQIDHTDTLANIFFRKVNDSLLEIKKHIFTNQFQYFQHQNLLKNLPLDQAVTFGDFTQNYLLAPNDEIESAHYCTPQVTIHTWYFRGLVHFTFDLLKNQEEVQQAKEIYQMKRISKQCFKNPSNHMFQASICVSCLPSHDIWSISGSQQDISIVV